MLWRSFKKIKKYIAEKDDFEILRNFKDPGHTLF